jgi:hydrogenase maturation protease
MDDLCQQLERCLHGRVCLIGLGNPDYADDGFGVCMAKALFDSGMPDVVVAETSPEKFIGEITASDFDNVLFVDAVELGTTPGSLVLLTSADLTARFAQISTHKLSLSLLAEWAESSGTSKAWLLGIQPKSLKPGSGLSDEVQKSLDAVKELILNLRVRDLESTIDVVT